MAVTISEDKISSTDLRGYSVFILMKAGGSGEGNPIYDVKMLPSTYGLQHIPNGQLIIEVEEPYSPATIDRVRTAIANKLAAR